MITQILTDINKAEKKADAVFQNGKTKMLEIETNMQRVINQIIEETNEEIARFRQAAKKENDAVPNTEMKLNAENKNMKNAVSFAIKRFIERYDI
ncbi:MAG: hypothetical protein LBH47_00550 [Christensenellaceae bacterium]|jgi:uncharacterized protein (DUF885 family)|nr:hypothetical protein [Christensenellaceae bacterium]